METSEIDRITPTLHPRGRLVMRQKWRDLLFLHWPIPVEELRPLVPRALELDLYQGTAYVGLVPFRMLGVRPIGFPSVPRLSRFHETNVRTYVHFKGRDPGVWFFSLDAANAIAVRIARLWFHLPYHHARMFAERESSVSSCSHLIDSSEFPLGASSLLYAGVRKQRGSTVASYLCRAQPVGTPKPAEPGTLEHFLVERYILYTTRKSLLYQGFVHHSPYPVQSAQVLALQESLLITNGIQVPATPPIVHFSEKVDVKVFNLLRVAES